MNDNAKKPELLCPASSLPVLKTAIRYGADAVYVGGDMYSLRAKAENFSDEELKDGIAFAHSKGKKVYVTVNVIPQDGEIEGISSYLSELSEIKPDALLIADPGVFSMARELCPDIDIHISTQANNTNYRTFLFWHSLGAKRVVTARELSLKEIKDIREHIPSSLEIESFVHGSMCISYSGRCLLSDYFTGRGANMGECTHPCRWRYYVSEETRPGEYLPVFENERGTYIFNSKDLCMIEHIPSLIESGVDSFKIEGRMKTALYVASTARAYRRAIDDLFESPEKYEANKSSYMEAVSECTYRQYTTGFYFHKPGHEDQIYDSNTYEQKYIYLGSVIDTDERGFIHLTQKNKFSEGDEIEIMKPDGTNEVAKVRGIYNNKNERVSSAPHPKEELFIDLGITAQEYDVLRMKANTGGD